MQVPGGSGISIPVLTTAPPCWLHTVQYQVRYLPPRGPAPRRAGGRSGCAQYSRHTADTSPGGGLWAHAGKAIDPGKRLVRRREFLVLRRSVAGRRASAPFASAVLLRRYHIPSSSKASRLQRKTAHFRGDRMAPRAGPIPSEQPFTVTSSAGAPVGWYPSVPRKPKTQRAGLRRGFSPLATARASQS